jgi:3-hydroxybutyryl-CoA dehydratase
MALATREAEVGTALPAVSKSISQPMIDQYGRVNDDTNLMHYDSDFARTRGYRDAIAHGLMTFAFASEMLGQYFGPQWAQGGKVRIKFIAPVYPGDTITTGGRVTAIDPEGAGKRLTVDVWCENQDGQPVLVGEASAMVV